MLQNATSLRKSAPWPPNISDEHVFCTVPATRNASLQIPFKCPTPCHRFWKCYTKPSRFAHFWQGAQSLAPATQNHIWTSKSAPYPSVFLTLLTWKCASRHNSVHFFDISTSKSGPNLVCFAHFDFEMCFAPQWRALFRHLNFQKWSEHGVLCTFWLRNVLRHNGVQFFISHLTSWLRTRRFGEPTFRPSGATNHWNILEKHSVSRLSYLFAHLPLLSSNSFSSLIFSLLLFSSLWLCPSLLFICPFCRKFDL